MARTKYKRECVVCGDIKFIQSKPAKVHKCKTCALLDFYNFSYKAVVYWYFCPDCNSIRELKTKRKSNFCSTCSRKRKLPRFFFDFNTLKMRTLIVTPKKTNHSSKEVTTKENTIKYSNTIDPLRVKREREKNKKHKEELARQKNKKTKTQTKTDEELITEFLKKNSVKTVQLLNDIDYC